MKHARIAYEGAIHAATDAGNGQIRLADGRLLAEDAVTWLPPIEPRTTFTLAINYADHAKELAFKAPAEPLGFLKAANTFVGHRARTLRPADVGFMHYECELAVVIGKTARNVTRAQAYDYVAGYTVANDYALRDYLENWYRPNLRVKSRDMVFDIPALIAYFSGFMTLSPGDLILTGTPDGIVNVQPGDEVVTEIDGIGRLVNTLVPCPA